MADGCDPEPQIPLGMALIAAGTFAMGDPFGTGAPEERPVHTVEVSGFFVDTREVTWALWQEVRAWALAHGYELAPGAGNGEEHPVQMVSWYDAVKWCNARSEREGLVPCYCISADRAAVYRFGRVDIGNDCVRWAADGYRLPTEAEWEKAARGGLSGMRFPSSNTLSHSEANYRSYAHVLYDVSPTRGYHPDYAMSPQPYTAPVGSFAPNACGLRDMAGNLAEWCWDWYDFSALVSKSCQKNKKSGEWFQGVWRSEIGGRKSTAAGRAGAGALGCRRRDARGGDVST